MISVLALVLQVQCGFQTIGPVTVSYGNVVFVTPEAQDNPQVAFFKTNQAQGHKHPYCDPLKKALSEGKPILIKVDESKDQVIEIQFPS